MLRFWCLGSHLVDRDQLHENTKICGIYQGHFCTCLEKFICMNTIKTSICLGLLITATKLFANEEIARSWVGRIILDKNIAKPLGRNFTVSEKRLMDISLKKTEALISQITWNIYLYQGGRCDLSIDFRAPNKPLSRQSTVTNWASSGRNFTLYGNDKVTGKYREMKGVFSKDKKTLDIIKYDTVSLPKDLGKGSRQVKTIIRFVRFEDSPRARRALP
jgi:hypothetical protein